MPHQSNNVRNTKQYMADDSETYHSTTEDPVSQEVPISKLTNQAQIQIIIFRLALLSPSQFLCIQAVLGNTSSLMVLEQ